MSVSILAAALVLMTGTAHAAEQTTEAALFRACAQQEQKLGNRDSARVFEMATRAIAASGQLPKLRPSRSTCLAMLSSAAMYASHSMDEANENDR